MSCKEKMHIQYITYIEGVACFLSWASEVDNDEDAVCIDKKDLKKMANTLFQCKYINLEIINATR